LVMTKGAIELLELDELKAVIQHELSHIQNKDMAFMTWGVTFLEALKYWIVVFLVCIVIYDVATTPPLLPPFLGWMTWLLSEIEWFITDILPFFLLLFVVIPVLTIYSVSRVREHLADAGAILFLESPYHLNSALRKIMRWKVEKQIVKKLISKIPTHLSVLSSSSSKKLPSFIVKHTIATHPSQKERLNAIKTEKYIIKSDKLPFLDLETPFYSGLIVFYAFFAEVFFASLMPVPSLILFFLPIFISIFINLYMIKYADPRVLGALGFKDWALYILSFVARSLITCGSFLAFVFLYVWWMDFALSREFIQLSVVMSGMIILFSSLLVLLVFLIKDALCRYKRRRITQA